MAMRLARVFSLAVVAAAIPLLATPAMADKDESDFQPIRVETIPDTFVRGFFNDSGDFYINRSLFRQANYMFGFGMVGKAGFPDLEIERDAKTINVIYNDVLDQQVSSDPLIRTPDLPNPFNSSIRMSPQSRPFGSRVEGSEFFFQNLPPR